MFRRPWQLEDEPSKADFIIESERLAMRQHLPVIVAMSSSGWSAVCAACWPVSQPISRLRRLPFRDGRHPRWLCGARVFWQARVGERNRARQLGEQLVRVRSFQNADSTRRQG